MKRSLLASAMNVALAKVDTHPEYEYFLHYSFIVQNNKIIEWGRNNKGEPALHYGYHKRIVDRRYPPKTHSEINAYKKARDLLDKNKPFEIINIRVSKNGQIRLSKPCNCCYPLLKELGCNCFYYSSEVGFLTIR